MIDVSIMTQYQKVPPRHLIIIALKSITKHGHNVYSVQMFVSQCNDNTRRDNSINMMMRCATHENSACSDHEAPLHEMHDAEDLGQQNTTFVSSTLPVLAVHSFDLAVALVSDTGRILL